MQRNNPFIDENRKRQSIAYWNQMDVMDEGKRGKVNAESKSPQDLFLAANKGDVKAIKSAIEAGVDVNSQNASNHGNTALIYAVYANKFDAVVLLLEEGAVFEINGGKGKLFDFREIYEDMSIPSSNKEEKNEAKRIHNILQLHEYIKDLEADKANGKETTGFGPFKSPIDDILNAAKALWKIAKTDDPDPQYLYQHAHLFNKKSPVLTFFCNRYVNVKELKKGAKSTLEYISKKEKAYQIEVEAEKYIAEKGAQVQVQAQVQAQEKKENKIKRKVMLFSSPDDLKVAIDQLSMKDDSSNRMENNKI